MNYTEKIRENFFGAHLQLGKIDHKPYKTIGACYFIVEHTQDKDFISKQIRQLLVAGCVDFIFFGKYAQLWHNQADVECVLLYSDVSDRYEPLTTDWSLMDKFIEDIFLTVSERTIVPCENYLFYDERSTYDLVLKRLAQWK